MQEEPQINPSLAKTGRDPLSEPNLMQASRSNGFPGRTERPSVREKLEGYKAEIVKARTERAKELAGRVVSRGIDAAANAARSAAEPGRDR